MSSASGHLGEHAAALADGQLGHAARDRALGHLAGCASCRAEVAQQRRVKSYLAQADVPGPASDLLQRLAGIPDRPRPPATAPGPWVAGRPALRPGGRPPGRRPSPARPQSRPPTGSRRPRGRGRRLLRRSLAGSAGLVALTLTAALVVGGSPAPATVTPASAQLIDQHRTTTDEVPLNDPGVAAVSVAYTP